VSADVSVRLITAGTPAELFAEVAMVPGAAAADQRSLSARREKDAARQRARQNNEKVSRYVTLHPRTSRTRPLLPPPPFPNRPTHTPMGNPRALVRTPGQCPRASTRSTGGTCLPIGSPSGPGHADGSQARARRSGEDLGRRIAARPPRPARGRRLRCNLRFTGTAEWLTISRARHRALVDRRTPEDAIALRQMTSSGALVVDEADLSTWITPAVRAALPAALAEARALAAPALGRDFTRLMTSSLVLVAGVGMTREDSRAWQAAAVEALIGIPADLLEIGCAAAKRACDHPSKILPTILKTVDYRWDTRRADSAKSNRIAAVADRTEEAPVEQCTPKQAADILRETGVAKPAAPARPEKVERPEPTAAE
jgi:hypothetical protein